VGGSARAFTNLLFLDFGLNYGQLEKPKTPHGEGLVAAGLLLDHHLALMDLHLCPEQNPIESQDRGLDTSQGSGFGTYLHHLHELLMLLRIHCS
jgi:hypothetical protein